MRRTAGLVTPPTPTTASGAGKRSSPSARQVTLATGLFSAASTTRSAHRISGTVTPLTSMTAYSIMKKLFSSVRQVTPVAGLVSKISLKRFAYAMSTLGRKPTSTNRSYASELPPLAPLLHFLIVCQHPNQWIVTAREYDASSLSETYSTALYLPNRSVLLASTLHDRCTPLESIKSGNSMNSKPLPVATE
ncbi:hypothetical protein FRB96_002818 [Tulasnella sp. 330]|nr:hypothetical protein FRB96_002818 [Tulasnella sp. 330]